MKCFLGPQIERSMITLFDLPDDVWASIIHEWTSKPIIVFSALDVAICNRSLRRKYFTLLEQAFLSKALQTSRIHFESNYHRISGICVSDPFLDWCEKRKLYPNSLSYSFIERRQKSIAEEDNKSEPRLTWNEFTIQGKKNTVKNLEKLKVRYQGKASSIPIVSNVLNDCPKLKYLEAQVHTGGSRFNKRPFVFAYGHGPYPLVVIELCGMM